MRPAERPRGLRGQFAPNARALNRCAYSGCDEDHIIGHRMCGPHRDWENATRKAYRAGRPKQRNNLPKQRAWRAKQARVHLCLSCGTDATPDRVRCQRCLDRRARVESERRGRIILHG